MSNTSNQTSATLTSSSEAYEFYRTLCKGSPVLSEAELRVEINVAGLAYNQVNDVFWATVLRRPDHRHVA